MFQKKSCKENQTRSIQSLLLRNSCGLRKKKCGKIRYSQTDHRWEYNTAHWRYKNAHL